MSVIYTPSNGSLEKAPDFRQPLIIPQPPLPTVAIVSDATESGFLIINASDFDASVHTRYEAGETPNTDASALRKKGAK